MSSARLALEDKIKTNPHMLEPGNYLADCNLDIYLEFVGLFEHPLTHEPMYQFVETSSGISIDYTYKKVQDLLDGGYTIEKTMQGNEVQSSGCTHDNKYINRAGFKDFWVCPDCKADLGDVK